MADFNFAKRGYQINQAYGCMNFPLNFSYLNNVDLKKLVDGDPITGIGIVDSWYVDSASMVGNTVTLSNLSHYQNQTPNAHAPASSPLLGNVGKPVPKINNSNFDIFGGTCHPVALGDTIGFTYNNTYADGAFATAGFDGLFFDVDIYQADFNGVVTGINSIASACTFPVSTSNCRLFADPYYNDAALNQYGQGADLIYITLFVWDWNGSNYDYFIETFGWSRTLNIIASVTNTMISGSPMPPPAYSGKHDMWFPCPSNGTSRSNIILCPEGSSEVYEFDVISGSFIVSRLGTAVCYSRSTDVICIADSNAGLFKTYTSGTLLGTMFVSSGYSGDWFDGDWHPSCVDVSNPSVDAFYFGDQGEKYRGQYKGWTVEINGAGTITNVRVGATDLNPSRINLVCRRVCVVAPNYLVMGPGPNSSVQQLIRVPCADMYKAYSYFGEYDINSVHEDFIPLRHPDCQDCAGVSGVYGTPQVLQGLEGGRGNNHLLLSHYNNSVSLQSINYLVMSDMRNNNIYFSNHQNFIIELGAVNDPGSGNGTSYLCISLTGLNATFRGGNGSYNLIKFLGA